MRRADLLFGSDNYATSAFADFLYGVQIPSMTLKQVDEELQKRFFQKGADGQPLERWELRDISFSCPLNQFKRHLAACGFLLATEPEGKIYVRAAWPGALASRAAVRLSDLISAWNSGVRWEETVVFGGMRPLQPLKEYIVECCKVLGIVVNEDTQAKEYVRLWDGINPQTELDMMRFLWQAASLEQPLLVAQRPLAPDRNY